MITILLFLLVYQILLIVVHLTVYATLDAAFGIGGLPLAVVFVALALTFVSASLIVRWQRGRAARWYYAASAYWFGLVHFLFMGAVAFFVATNVFNWLNIYIPPAWIGGICFGVAFLIHLYGTLLPERTTVARITVPVKGLPEFWKTHTVVFFSDVHLGSIHRGKFMEKICKKVAALNPAAVLIGGDLFDGPKCDAEAAIAPLGKLRMPHGIYYVAGNHEYHGDVRAFFDAIEKTGIRRLNNERKIIEGMAFIGIDDHFAHDKETFAALLAKAGVAKGMPNILMAHQPMYLGVARDAGIALGLFGHTHRGQIFPLNWFTKRIYGGFDYGLRTFDSMWVYTSSGVGTWGPPLRLGTRSEIVLIQFKKED